MYLWRDEDLLRALEGGTPFARLGLSNTSTHRTLSFLDDLKYLRQIFGNTNITGLITSADAQARVSAARPDMTVIIREDPRLTFYTLHNRFVETLAFSAPASQIDASACIHRTAYVAETGVRIGAGVVVEPLVKIMPGVEIGSGSVIRAGSALGVEGFEHKRTSAGILSVRHDGRVLIGERVEIGANNTIARGLMGMDTIIGDETKTDCLVHVAHSVRIGRRCLLPACAMIAGSAQIGDDVWIGPNASISSQVKIGPGAFVTIGSVVVRNVEDNARVTGNFAMKHATFLRNLKAATSTRKTNR